MICPFSKESCNHDCALYLPQTKNAPNFSLSVKWQGCSLFNMAKEIHEIWEYIEKKK